VTRSHGLEHFDRQQLLDGALRGTERVSWKYRIWWGGLNILLVERSLRLADRCVFLNDADREYSVERLGIARARTTVTHHGLAEYLRFLPLDDIEPAEAAPRVVFLGTFNKRKGSDMAVAVLSGVLRRWATARVALIGTRVPAPEVLKCFAPSLRSRIDVVQHFRNEQLPALLRGKHVLISPSRSEGFGKAIIEGMACGLVPVATDIPGPHDILSQTGGGVLVPPGDADAMLAAVVNLVEDEDLLRRKRAVANAASRGYSWDAAAAEREAVYLGAVRHMAAGDRSAPARS
jgi:glycosyltransferase involved in cell wall biosynthesis